MTGISAGLAGITADAVENVLALRFIGRRSPRLVPAMRTSSRIKWLTPLGLTLLLLSAVLGV